MRHVALFPGSFNPFTIGHADIAERASRMFDEVIIAIGYNVNKERSPELNNRVDSLRNFYKKHNPRVRVETYTGLTADFAREMGATVLLRGIRDSKDFEYERSLADANRSIEGLDTVFLSTRPELSYISSSLIRELEAFGRDVTPFLGDRED